MKSIDISNVKLNVNKDVKIESIVAFLSNPFDYLNGLMSNYIIVSECNILRVCIQTTKEDKTLHDLDIVIELKFDVYNSEFIDVPKQVDISKGMNCLVKSIIYIFKGLNINVEKEESSCIITIKSSDKVI